MICLICNERTCLWDCYRPAVEARGRDLFMKYCNNKQVRFHLYRYFTTMHHGTLGQGVRVKIPECVEWEIRKLYPDEEGNGYVGFQANGKSSLDLSCGQLAAKIRSTQVNENAD